MLEVTARIPIENMVSFFKHTISRWSLCNFASLEYELNEPGNEDSESGVSSDGHMDLSNEEADEVCSLNGPQYTFNDEETKSRFTEYSMSSSVMKRNEQLTLLDDKFEKVYIFMF